MSKTINSYIREILLMEKNANKKSGAGFIVVKKINGTWKVLGLLADGEYDIPKGAMEPADQGNAFKNACRECYEECSITVTPQDLKWGSSPLQLSHLTLFLVETSQTPQIKKNIKSGIYEHQSAEWLNWNEMEQNIIPYLRPALYWAKSKVH